MTNTIDIITPTMWYNDSYIDYLKQYCDYSAVKSIILIDNQKSRRPQDPILNHPKIKIVCYNKNIYVNPALNEGYYRSDADVLCILNDDVFVEKEIFNWVQELDMTEIDVIGSRLKGSEDNYSIAIQPGQEDELIKLDVLKNLPIGSQSYAFGACMFMKRSSYNVIPSLYQVWFGDEYLIQNCKNVYVFKTNKITGALSKTLQQVSKKGPIQKRLELDAHNAANYHHLKGAKHWDIIKHTLQPKRNIFGY